MLALLGHVYPQRPARGLFKIGQKFRAFDIVCRTLGRLNVDLEGVGVRVDGVDAGRQPFECIQVVRQQQTVAGLVVGFVEDELLLIAPGVPGKRRIAIGCNHTVDPVPHQAGEAGIDVGYFLAPHPFDRIAPDALD